jgi:2-polyprenyl-3-methyl-5-hydroxy-6-metoxy-1,4-benzoquinol methylase
MELNCPTLEQQRSWWNSWDQEHLGSLDRDSLRRGATVLSLLKSLPLRSPNILEVGCGNGWLCEKLVEIGRVTGVDIADSAIADARCRVPNATFFSGDFSSLKLPVSQFDVALTLETLSHVPDQKEFVRNLAAVLKHRGYLIVVTQNRTVYSRRSNVGPQGVCQIRHWLTMHELLKMLRPLFKLKRAFTIQPSGDKGFLRIVNSARINRVLSLAISPPILESLKEMAGFGQSLVVLTQRR